MNLRERINAAVAAQQAIVDASRAAGRTELTEAEQRDFDAQQATINSLREQEAAEERNAAIEAARTAERQRINDIGAMCREFDIGDKDSRRLMDDPKMTVDGARAAIMEILKRTRVPAGVGVKADESDKFRAAAADGLCMRAGVSVEKPAPGANEFRGMSLRDLAIECLMRENQANASDLLRMSPEDLLAKREFYSPTSAFPSILDNTINKSIVKLYNETPTTFQAWTQKGSVKDFKTTSDHKYLLGSAGALKKVPENGELEHDTIADMLLPSRKIDTYGRNFSMSRQAFINDDIGFITEVPGLYAISAKKTIDEQVYTLVYANSNIYDGKALFHNDHGNLIGSGAAPDSATVQAAILKMQKQTDPFGKPIVMTPMYLVVPMGYEFTLKVMFGSAQEPGGNHNDLNPMYNYPLQVVQSPVLNSLAGANAAPWFLVSAPSSARCIQVDYLNGVEVPTIRRMEAAGVLGFSWDIYLDWGVAVVDWRGILKNPGATIS